MMDPFASTAMRIEVIVVLKGTDVESNASIAAFNRGGSKYSIFLVRLVPLLCYLNGYLPMLLDLACQQLHPHPAPL